MGSVAAFSILLTKDNLLTTFQSPLYAWSQSPASNNDRTPSHHTSSSSSLERSTNPSSQYAASSSNDPYNNRHQYPSHQLLDEREIPKCVTASASLDESQCASGYTKCPGQHQSKWLSELPSQTRSTSTPVRTRIQPGQSLSSRLSHAHRKISLPCSFA